MFIQLNVIIKIVKIGNVIDSQDTNKYINIDAKEQTLLIKIGYKKQTTLSRWITHFYSFEFGKKVVLSSIFSETTELALTIQLEPINFPGINEQ